MIEKIQVAPVASENAAPGFLTTRSEVSRPRTRDDCFELQVQRDNQVLRELI